MKLFRTKNLVWPRQPPPSPVLMFLTSKSLNLRTDAGCWSCRSLFCKSCKSEPSKSQDEGVYFSFDVNEVSPSNQACWTVSARLCFREHSSRFVSVLFVHTSKNVLSSVAQTRSAYSCFSVMPFLFSCWHTDRKRLEELVLPSGLFISFML
jgi:hypothetical protein